MAERRRTTTSNFGVSARENHDATPFYDRFRPPDISDDQEVLPPKPVAEPFVLGDARRMDTIADGSVALVVMRIGIGMLRMLATPVPEPPPPGELRKVRLTYRCSICSTEVRMTAANDDVPDPPRHCQEDMDLVTPVDDL